MKNLKSAILIVLTLFFHSFTYGQFYWDEETSRDYIISKDTPADVLDRYLASVGFEDIEFNPDTSSSCLFRYKLGGTWGIYVSNNPDFEDYYHNSKFDLLFPFEGFEGSEFTVASIKGKNYLYNFLYDVLHKKFWFEEIVPHSRKDTLEYLNHYDELISTEKVSYLFAIKQKKWGVIQLESLEGGDLRLLAPKNYTNKNDLPINELNEILGQDIQNEQFGISPFLPEISLALAYYNFDSISFRTNPWPLMRGKRKKGDWQLLRQGNDLVDFEGYSVDFPVLTECGTIYLAKRKSKYYPFSSQIEGRELQEELWLDEILPVTETVHEPFVKIDENPESPNFGFEMMDSLGNYIYETITSVRCKHVALRRGDLWALGYYSHASEFIYQLSGFSFKSPKELPDSLMNIYGEIISDFEIIYDENKMFSVHEYLLKDNDVDLIEYFGTYPVDPSSMSFRDMFKVRHAETGRWSILIPGGFREDADLPTAAESIEEIKTNNGKILIVTCNEYIGLYYYNKDNIKEIIPCEYEDYKYLFLDARYGIAMKKSGKWTLHDHTNGKKLIEGSSVTIDGLVELWLNR